MVEDLRVHVVCVSQAKFSYTVQLASRSQTSSRPNSIRLSKLRPAREQVYRLRPARELVASKAGHRNGIWSRTGLQPATELDSVIEFGFNWTTRGLVKSRSSQLVDAAATVVVSCLCFCRYFEDN